MAQHGFQRSILNGAMFCGGACFHTYCITYVAKYLNSLSPNALYEILEIRNTEKLAPKFLKLSLIKKVKQLFSSYTRCVLENDLDEYKIDLECGHVFRLNSSHINCECGLFKLTSTASSDLLLVDFFNDFSLVECQSLLSFNEKNSDRLVKNEENAILLDCYESKLNAFKIARDILSSVLHVGVFVYN